MIDSLRCLESRHTLMSLLSGLTVITKLLTYSVGSVTFSVTPCFSIQSSWALSFSFKDSSTRLEGLTTGTAFYFKCNLHSPSKRPILVLILDCGLSQRGVLTDSIWYLDSLQIKRCLQTQQRHGVTNNLPSGGNRGWYMPNWCRSLRGKVFASEPVSTLNLTSRWE